MELPESTQMELPFVSGARLEARLREFRLRILRLTATTVEVATCPIGRFRWCRRCHRFTQHRCLKGQKWFDLAGEFGRCLECPGRKKWRVLGKR